MDAGFHWRSWIEKADDTCARAARIRDTDQCPSLRKIDCHEQAARARHLRSSGSLAISDERDFPRASRFGRRNASDIQIAIALPDCLQFPCDLGDSQSRPPATPVSYKLMPVDPSAVVAPTARVHASAQVGPQAMIGEYVIV